MPVVECQGCGRRLELPGDFPEAGDFACAHCGLWMRNVEAARAFRWASFDPYVRRHGASRLNLWGGFAGSVLWLPIVLAVLASRGAMTAPLALAIAVPYLALMLWLVRRRAGAPAMLWIQWLWAGLGSYLIYVWALLQLVPGWRRLLEGAAGPEGASALRGLGRYGALALAIGLLGAWFYRRRVRRLPQMRGAAPEG
ncbi:MAG TPA: hypothetical protein VFR85_14555 [Anaeromyxobacteraceae bacterium]|nr:hypothetical protein [Anaeromyxobacteraceae bacterium]